jgi:serine phosphatase RsbU (regulator of sigma subunit)
MERDEALFAQQQVVRLQALLEASRRIHATIALDEVLGTALQIVVRELELTGAFFTHFPHKYGEVSDELMAELAEPEESETAFPVAVELSEDTPLPNLRITPELLLRFPLWDKAGVPMTELVVIQPADRVLTLDETDFIESLAIQAAVAIENARFHERMVRWQRLESDLASAHLIQSSLLPQRMPDIPGYSLATRSVTCYAVGGDYLDIVPMESGELTIVVADVAGKGLTSALVGSSFRSAFRAMVNSGVPLVEIATKMNLLHYNEGEESRRRYVTAIFVQLDPATDSMQVVNAGHNPAFLVGPSVDGRPSSIQLIKASGTPVGMLPFSSYEAEKYSLPMGARLLLYTDGLTEVFCDGEEFGEVRLLDTFVDCEPVSAEGVVDSLWSTLNQFGDEEEQSDDMTALVLLRQD